MDWFEAISENYMDTGGRPLHILEQIRARYPLALHGTSLSIGSTDPLSRDYLVRLKNLIQRVDPFIVSDHLCWSGVEGKALHDLLPLPFTEEAVRHVTERVQEVQEFIGRPILLENVSTYVTYRHSTLPEWEFLAEVAGRSGCGILLDLNNVYVNSFNHRFDPLHYIRSIPGERVGQFHLAGHTDRGKFLFDTHSDHVIEPVWELYKEALRLWGPVSTLIEWDEAIPSFETLSEEAEKARVIQNAVITKRRFKNNLVGAPLVGALKRAGTRPAPTISLKSLSLFDVQRWIKARIHPEERQFLFSGSSQTILNPQAGDPGEDRMEVYAAGYLARIKETLSEVYESVRQVMGLEEFDKLSERYARLYPSRHYNLNFAGRHFPEFFRSSNKTLPSTPSPSPLPLPGGEDKGEGRFPFLSDLARLEWAIWEAFHAFDAPPLQVKDVSGLTPEEWEKVQFEFQPSVALMESPWPILDIWLERKKKEPGLEEGNRSPRRQGILVGRKEDQVRCELLDENQYRLLEGLLKGRTLGEVCGEMAEDLVEGEMPPVSDWFSRWVQDGLIREIHPYASRCSQ